MLSVRIQLLGPIEALVDGDRVDLRGPRQRRLLGALALRASALVDTGQLMDAVWPEADLPANPREVLRTYVSRLRVSLGGPQRIIGRDGGYLLDLPAEAIDVHCFEAMVARARHDREVGAAERSLATLEDALALWRGPPLGGFDHEEWARPDAVRLAEMAQLSIEDRSELRLELGRHLETVGELEAMVAAQPLRPRAHRLLMVALQRCGRQAEALRVFEAYRRRLATDLGLEPDEELRATEAQIAQGQPAALGAPSTPKGLRGYELLERIGEGAFAEVYRAAQPALGREVAIKVIRAELANQADFVRRFEAEAHLVARLEHPYVVPLYDYWREPGAAYLVMRLLPESLQDRLASGRLSLDLAGRLVTQVGSALSTAHAAGVVHRDVKPANIFCDRDGNFYLGDFGIATEVTPDGSTPPPRSVGSRNYAPAEQLRHDHPTPQVDVYGLGLVLFESLTGVLPSPGVAPPPLAAFRADLPAALDVILARAMAGQPDHRYNEVTELVTAAVDALRSPHAGADAAPPGEFGAPGGVGVAPTARGARRPPVAERSNPYKGLRAFQEADSGDFFGRQALVERLVERLRQPGPAGRLIAVVGPSGSGKSSVVRAGLLPAVRQGAVAGSARWFVTSMMPGAQPWDELASALQRVATEAPELHGRLAGADRRRIGRTVAQILPNEADDLLLVVDQFEELFTLCPDETVRRSFIDALVAAVTDRGSRVRVVLTLRADFFDRPLRYGELAPLIEAGTITVAPLAAEELEAAIVQPAARVGMGFEPGLVARIIGDVIDQPGALPLLQYAMTELFDLSVSASSGAGRWQGDSPDPDPDADPDRGADPDCDPDVMTVAAYRELGGLSGALARRAEQLFRIADQEQRGAMRRAVTRLVSPGEGREDTRRRVLRRELGTDPATGQVVADLGVARLVSFDIDPATREPTVEVAHEALIREWPRLGAWLDQDRDGLRTHRHLTAAASGWQSAERDAGELYRGARLETAEAWAGANDADLNNEERTFLEASKAAHRADLEAVRARAAERDRQHRRLRRLLVAVATVALLAILAGTLAAQQRGLANDRAATANRAAFDAETGRMVAEATQLVTSNPRIAMLLAAEAHRREPGPRTLGALQRVLTGTGPLLGFFGGGTRYGALRWLDEHRMVAARSTALDVFRDDGTLERSMPIAGVTAMVPAPDGTRLALIAQGTASVLSLASGQLSGLGGPTSGSAQALAWSADGAELAVGTSVGDVVAYDSATGQERWRQLAHPERTLSELHLPNTIAETAPHLPLASVRGVSAVALLGGTGDSSDPPLVATAGFGYLRVWQRDTTLDGPAVPITEVTLTRPSGAGELVTVAVAMDVSVVNGSRRVIVADRYRAWVVDPANLAPTQQMDLPAPRSSSNALDLERQVIVAGTHIVSDYQLGMVYITDVERPTEPRSLISHLPNNLHLALDPLGVKLALSSTDGLAVLSLVDDGLIARSFDIGPGDVQISDDGVLVSRFDYGHRIAELWRLTERGAVAVPISGIEPGMVSVIGNDALVLDFGAGVGILNMPDGTLRAMLQGSTPVQGMYAAAISRDRDLVAIGTGDGLTLVYSMRNGALLHRFTELQATSRAPMRALQFDPAGTRLVGNNVAGTAVVWDLAQGTHAVLARPTSRGAEVPLFTDFVQASFTPDGKQLITQSSDGIMTMRDATTLQPTGKQFIGNTSGGSFDFGPFFSADGRFLFSAGDLQARLWDVDSGQQIGGTFPFEADFVSNLSSNARWLVTGQNGRVVRWELDVDAWPQIVCRASGRNLTADEWDRYGPTGPPRITCPEYPSPLASSTR